MACLFYGGLEWSGALADGNRLNFPEPGAEPNFAPSRNLRIDHMELCLRIHPVEKRFSGRSTVSFTALPDFNGVVQLDLDDVTVKQVTDPDGSALVWRHRGAILEIETQGNAVCVAWEGQSSGRGMYFTGPQPWVEDRQSMAWTQCQDEDGHFVFPCHDHPRIKHSWTIRLEAPEGYTLLSNGTCTGEGIVDGFAWANYSQPEPMPAYLFTAVAARLSQVETQWRDRPVRYFVPEGEEEAIIRSMGKTPLMMEKFSELVGVEYPWSRYDQVVVHDFVFGGMENIACTTMTDLLLVPENAVLQWDPDGLVAHELAHQWFGDLVTCQDWSQGWLNESWATFMETMWWQHDREEDEATWYRYSQARGYFGEAASRYQRPIVAYRFKEPIDVFDRHLYEKGSCVLSTLRFELGPEAFWRGTKAYLMANREDTVHTRHFQRAMERESGRTLDQFFEQWIHSPGHPKLTVKMSSADNLLQVTVQQTQKGADVPECYAFHLGIELVFDSGEVQVIRLPVRSRNRTYALPVKESIRTVRVDPGFQVLAEMKLEASRAWLQVLVQDSCPVLAVRAATALLAMDGVHSLQAVSEALTTHPGCRVRADIARQLGRRGGDACREILLGALDAEEDPRVCTALVSSLAKYRDAGVLTALQAALDKEGMTCQLKGGILHAMGTTRIPAVFDELLPSLEEDSWGSVVVRGALMGLAAMREPRAAQVLVERCGSQYNGRIRSAAASALAHLADHVESVRPVAVETLVEMVEEGGFRTSLAALGGLARIKEPKCLPVLQRVHQAAPDGRVRRAAYESISHIQQGRTTEAGLATLRGRVEELSNQNEKLRARIDRLEPTPKS